MDKESQCQDLAKVFKKVLTYSQDSLEEETQKSANNLSRNVNKTGKSLLIISNKTEEDTALTSKLKLNRKLKKKQRLKLNQKLRSKFQKSKFKLKFPNQNRKRKNQKLNPSLLKTKKNQLENTLNSF